MTATRSINTTPLEITWPDVLELVALAYYQGLMVEMTKGSDSPVVAPAFTLTQLAAMRALLGEGPAALGEADLGLTSALSTMIGNEFDVDELAARRPR